MDEKLKQKVLLARELAREAFIAIEQLDDLLVGVDDETADYLVDEVRAALAVVQDMTVAVGGWHLSDLMLEEERGSP
jgi:TfoX/Sxy family transcriptional regulator of competence genes